MDRRTIIKRLMWGAGIPLLGENVLTYASSGSSFHANKNSQPPLHLFTKVLQWVPLQDLPQTVRDMGFAGIDIAVRGNGHFTVGDLKAKLPQLVAGCARLGMDAPILTTELIGDNLREMEEFLKIVSGEGVRHYRMGWLKYQGQEVMAELNAYNGRLKKLAELHRKYQVQGHYQNHAGNGVGGSVWELLYLLEGIDPRQIGIQFDLRHAVVEGYRSWETAFQVIKDKITTLDIKDFKWENSKGKDRPVTVPLGKGNVDFTKITSSAAFESPHVPKILHVEHNLGGAEHGRRDPDLPGKEILAAIRRDVLFLNHIAT